MECDLPPLTVVSFHNFHAHFILPPLNDFHHVFSPLSPSFSLSSFYLPLLSILEFFQVEKKSNLLEIEWMNECVCDSLHQFTFSLSQLHSVLLHLNSTDGRLSCVQVWLGAGNICYLWLLPSSPLTHLHISLLSLSLFPSPFLSLSLYPLATTLASTVAHNVVVRIIIRMEGMMITFSSSFWTLNLQVPVFRWMKFKAKVCVEGKGNGSNGNKLESSEREG